MTAAIHLPLTPRQASRLRWLLIGEIGQPNIEETYRRTCREILARLELEMNPKQGGNHVGAYQKNL